MPTLAILLSAPAGRVTLELRTRQRFFSRRNTSKSLFLHRFGHDVARVRRQSRSLELNGCVIDAEFLRGFLLNRSKQAFALIEVHIRNARVQAQSVVTAAERPDVHVVHLLHALNLKDGTGNFFNAHLARAALEKNVRGFPENADAGPQYEQADGDAEEWIDPEGSSHSNSDCANNDGDVR